MRAFDWLDDLLFDRLYQPLVNRFPEAGPVGVARFFLMGNMVAWLTMLYRNYMNGDSKAALWAGLGFVPLMLCYAVIGMIRQTLGRRNPMRAMPMYKMLRALGLFGVAVDAAFYLPWDGMTLRWSLQIASDILWTSYLYAEACDRMPPKISREVPAGLARRI